MSRAPVRRSVPRLREALRDRRARAARILELLRETYGEARTELDYDNPFQLLISVILSAQATDVSVNLAGPRLYARFPDAEALSVADIEEVMSLISSIGLYRTKARNIIRTAQLLTSKHAGQVPDTMEELLALPGVGRKTANVVLGVLYGVPSIAVDTHVGRLARRLGFSREDNPDKVELDLQRVLPPDHWVYAHHALILHGRRVCAARKPACGACVLADHCPSRDAFG